MLGAARGAEMFNKGNNSVDALAKLVATRRKSPNSCGFMELACSHSLNYYQAMYAGKKTEL